MTTATKRDEIRFDIVERIPINVMNVCFSFFSTNFADVRSIFRKFFKTSMTMFKCWKMLIGIKFSNTFFRAKLTFIVFFSRFSYRKFLLAVFAFTRNLSFSSFIRAFSRTIFLFRVFKPAFSNVKLFVTRSAIHSNLRYFKSFIRAFCRAKTLLLVDGSMLLNVKGFIANSACQFNSIISKLMLANSRAKEVFMPFNLVSICFKRFAALGAFCNHKQDVSTRTIYCQPTTSGANAK